MEAAKNYAIKKIRKEYEDINANVDNFTAGFVDDDVFVWNLVIEGPPDTLYEGGLFQAILKFPYNYPNFPPEMSFTTKMWHPNIYPDGKVCISILHPPEEDETNE